MFVFVGAPLVLHSLGCARRNLGPRGVAMALAVGLLGLTPYLYLMSASAAGSAVSWGDQTTIGGLVAHVLRYDYGTFSMGRQSQEGVFVTGGTFLPTLWHMWGNAFPRLLWFGPVVALAGLYVGLRRQATRVCASVLLIVSLFYGLCFAALSNLSTSRPLYLTVLDRFCIESDLLLAIAAGLGFAAAFQGLGRRWPTTARWSRFLPGFAGVVFALGIALHAERANARSNTMVRDFVMTAFASLPPNAIVITMGDELTGPFFYFHEVEKLRPDVIHFDRDRLGASWYTARERSLHHDMVLPRGTYGKDGWSIKQLLDKNPNRPVVVVGHLDDWDQSWNSKYKLIVYGLVYAHVPAGEVPTYEAWAQQDRKAIGNYDVAPALRAPDDSWEHALGERALGTQAARAHLSLLYGSEQRTSLEPARNALRLLEDVVAKAGGDPQLKIAPSPGVRKLYLGAAVWKDLGIAYEVLSQDDESYVPRVVIAYKKFIDCAEPDDPDVATVRKFLGQTRMVTHVGRGLD